MIVICEGQKKKKERGEVMEDIVKLEIFGSAPDGVSTSPQA